MFGVASVVYLYMFGQKKGKHLSSFVYNLMVERFNKKFSFKDNYQYYSMAADVWKIFILLTLS